MVMVTGCTGQGQLDSTSRLGAPKSLAKGLEQSLMLEKVAGASQPPRLTWVCFQSGALRRQRAAAS